MSYTPSYQNCIQSLCSSGVAILGLDCANRVDYITSGRFVQFISCMGLLQVTIYYFKIGSHYARKSKTLLEKIVRICSPVSGCSFCRTNAVYGGRAFDKLEWHKGYRDQLQIAASNFCFAATNRLAEASEHELKITE